MNEATPSQQYLSEVRAFEATLEQCTEVSRRFANIPSPHSRHFFASALFTTLCVRCASMAVLLPRSTWSQKRVDLWDYASIASLSRGILEIRLTFYYLSVDKCRDEEWAARKTLLDLHDCVTRLKLFTDLGDKKNIEGFEQEAKELRDRLSANVFFNRLQHRDQRRYLKGRESHFEPLETIAERVDVDSTSYRVVHRIASNHIHGLPMSFYRMDGGQRGRGVYSETEEGYSMIFITFVRELMTDACREMNDLFAFALPEPESK